MTVPVAVQKGPYPIAVEDGKSYYWCACGQSKTQPFCDGSHKGSGFAPLPYKAEASRTLDFCGCKSTGNAPFCDGSHARL